MSEDTWASVQKFLSREAMLLDQKDWESWLELYRPNCKYWVPAWRDDGTLVEDTDKEISLIYYNSRIGLEGRVYRVRKGHPSSYSSLARTCHFNQLQYAEWLSGSDEKVLKVRSNWSTYSTVENSESHYFGYAEYDLVEGENGWKILNKKTIVMNDMIHEVLDFYHI
ncbi:aromatic-ring-hydroxylating dioxygenase subunit beta [Marinobacter salarius]|uniref:aromatic-ring-hydroxylating dioxygenase subunit beta n=1 Tax=Marinobacter salarius TaxID=1420917 RepID=UPI00273C078D|nr:aromatic-ring-hydroxylating dioxygenase subunit beta [Marinobacter salarius]MDP4533523.1 aromatic-ring-hydroxylating dioxygenase subunit beta [Marinobacter salarius]